MLIQSKWQAQPVPVAAVCSPTKGSYVSGNQPIAEGITNPPIDELLKQSDSKYKLVLFAAKRARQINAYYHSLSEGSYGEHTPPMVETSTGNYLTIALEEVANGKIKYEYKA